MERGYNVALWRDPGAVELTCTVKVEGPYPGYAKSVNALIAYVLNIDEDAEWFVTGGDDVNPDPDHTPEHIAAECFEHFGGTFGVMQPTGDRWANGSIDRICGSPWMGRGFCESMYGGQGPLWPNWFHCFVDEELQCVAQKLGVLWQRSDLIHRHNHWLRCEGPRDVNWRATEPEHLKDKNLTLHRDRPLFEDRKAHGFPGHQPVMI